jgi:DNA-binding transcriptional LysR family regulator
VAFFIERKLNSPPLVSLLEWPEPIALLAAPAHPLARFECIMPKDLEDTLLILAETGCSYRNLFLQMLDRAGVSPRSMMESSSVQVMKQLAVSGLGITLLPRVAVISELAEGKLVELAWAGPAFEMITQVVHHKDKWISPAMRAFIELAGDLLLPDGQAQ